jgi:hypothetical protein
MKRLAGVNLQLTQGGCRRDYFELFEDVEKYLL